MQCRIFLHGLFSVYLSLQKHLPSVLPTIFFLSLSTFPSVLSCFTPTQLCWMNNGPRANCKTDTRSPSPVPVPTQYPARPSEHETLSRARLHESTLISVGRNVLWTNEAAGAGSIHKTFWSSRSAGLRYSQTGSSSHPVFSWQKSSTDIKENVRLLCSGCVICLTKRLSFTSGDDLHRLCYSGLLAAEVRCRW